MTTKSKTIQALSALLFGKGAPRIRGRRPVGCEVLEGRQLLSTASVGAWPTGGHGMFPGGPLGGSPTSAHVVHFDGKGGHGPGGTSNPSAQLKADFATLQTDMKALRAEVPASLTATLKADQAVVSKAFASIAPPKGTGHHMPHSGSFTPGNKPAGTPPNMTALLEKAGVSTSQATQIASDFQTYQTTLKSLDPTLQSKITADQAAITKDGGPTLPAGHMGHGQPW